MWRLLGFLLIWWRNCTTLFVNTSFWGREKKEWRSCTILSRPVCLALWLDEKEQWINYAILSENVLGDLLGCCDWKVLRWFRFTSIYRRLWARERVKKSVALHSPRNSSQLNQLSCLEGSEVERRKNATPMINFGGLLGSCLWWWEGWRQCTIWLVKFVDFTYRCESANEKPHSSVSNPSKKGTLCLTAVQQNNMHSKIKKI